MATGTKLLKKLTLRTFIGSKAEILAYAMSAFKDGKPEGAAQGEMVPVLRVLGNVTGFKAGESDFGSYVQLNGDFIATNLQTGEVLDACSKAILPNVIGDSVAEAIKNGAESVQFAVELDVQYVEKAATMYEFHARSLIKPAIPKPLEALMATMQAQGIAMTPVKALAAPAPTAEQIAAQKESEAKAEATQKAAAEKAATAKGGKEKATAK